MNAVKTQIIKIGNSHGIRIPKPLIRQLGPGRVEIAVLKKRLVIRPLARPRSGWSKQFRAMARHNDDRLLDEPVPTRWDRDEWEW